MTMCDIVKLHSYFIIHVILGGSFYLPYLLTYQTDPESVSDNMEWLIVASCSVDIAPLKKISGRHICPIRSWDKYIIFLDLARDLSSLNCSRASVHLNLRYTVIAYSWEGQIMVCECIVPLDTKPPLCKVADRPFHLQGYGTLIYVAFCAFLGYRRI